MGSTVLLFSHFAVLYEFHMNSFGTVENFILLKVFLFQDFNMLGLNNPKSVQLCLFKVCMLLGTLGSCKVPSHDRKDCSL